MGRLPLRDKTKIAKMDKSDLTVLHMTIGPHIRDEFGLLKGNHELLESCRILSGQDQLHMEAVSAMIINLLCGRARFHILAAANPVPEGWPATG